MQNGGVHAREDAPVPTAAAAHYERRDRECVLLHWGALQRLLGLNSWGRRASRAVVCLREVAEISE